MEHASFSLCGAAIYCYQLQRLVLRYHDILMNRGLEMPKQRVGQSMQVMRGYLTNNGEGLVLPTARTFIERDADGMSGFVRAAGQEGGAYWVCDWQKSQCEYHAYRFIAGSDAEARDFVTYLRAEDDPSRPA